ncbi:hypothetical protein LJC31_07085, partial [Synergistaceae bacterium OttesenSCG-928-I11]|nr:hypothetical protein [Synergistaceae bacterium OttesenSCG-928-I11]
MQTIKKFETPHCATRKFFSFPIVPLLALFATILLQTSATAATPTMELAFWTQDWRTMDAIAEKIASRSADAVPPTLSMQETSLYLNGLWRQGRHAEGLEILETLREKGKSFPEELQPYADMLAVLALERTDRKQEAYERGSAIWE